MQSASSKGGHAEFGGHSHCQTAQVHCADDTDSRVNRTPRQSKTWGLNDVDIEALPVTSPG